MNLPKELTTVTRLSKTLAMILFVALPFVGFYYGRMYQQSMDQYLSPFNQIRLPAMMGMKKPSEASPTTSLDINNWKEFKDPSKKFSLNFPQNWLISFVQSPRYKDKMDIKIEGPEGHVDIIWADSYGGACQDPGYEKIKIKSGTETICHAYHIQQEGADNNAEFWQLQKQFTKSKPEGIYVNAYSNKNPAVLKQILQSLNITA